MSHFWLAIEYINQQSQARTWDRPYGVGNHSKKGKKGSPKKPKTREPKHTSDESRYEELKCMLDKLDQTPIKSSDAELASNKSKPPVSVLESPGCKYCFICTFVHTASLHTSCHNWADTTRASSCNRTSTALEPDHKSMETPHTEFQL